MLVQDETQITQILKKAVNKRKALIDPEHQSAWRVFNGFYEGNENIVADLYGTTLVLFSYSENEEDSISLSQTTRDVLLEALPWIKCVVVKRHHAESPEQRKGEITFGSHPETLIRENGINYAVDLLLNQDASFYLDTRHLREWLQRNSSGKDVLNTFAYTGSLGTAALAGGARQVIQMDRNRKFLDLSRRSVSLNHLDLGKMKLQPVDFFVGVNQLKRSGSLFDLVIIDPPFFSVTDKGLVDQTSECTRLINKIRPLVRNGGTIIAINNALFLTGKEYLIALETLGKDGYLEVEEFISVPEDIAGYPDTIVDHPPVDPAPFNHPTKIAVLKVKRKSN